jgi:glucokinase
MIGALDIGGTKIAVGIIDENGRLLAREERPTDPDKGFEAGLSRITAMLKSAAIRAGVSIRGIGIGCTGRHNIQEGILGDVEAFLPGWQDAPIAGRLTRSFGVPVALENDADAAAMGEYAFGTGRGMARYIYVTVSTGIGRGLVFDGELYRGVGGAHPEIGHHVIERTGPHCFCGAQGCWESMASGSAMACRWLEKHPESRENVPPIDARQIANLARQGDPQAKKAVIREGRYLGIGLSNLITLFAPDTIALGGGVMGSWDLFEEQARAIIEQNCGLVPYHKINITPVELGPEVVLIGAAAAWSLRFGK